MMILNQKMYQTAFLKKKNKAQLENKSLYLQLLREGHKEG